MKFKKYIAVKAEDIEEEFDNAIVALSEQLEYSEYIGQITEDNVLDRIYKELCEESGDMKKVGLMVGK